MTAGGMYATCAPVALGAAVSRDAADTAGPGAVCVPVPTDWGAAIAPNWQREVALLLQAAQVVHGEAGGPDHPELTSSDSSLRPPD